MVCRLIYGSDHVRTHFQRVQLEPQQPIAREKANMENINNDWVYVASVWAIIGLSFPFFSMCERCPS